jgi:hypothetical protein
LQRASRKLPAQHHTTKNGYLTPESAGDGEKRQRREDRRALKKAASFALSVLCSVARGERKFRWFQ